jgi:hypothetical protein
MVSLFEEEAIKGSANYSCHNGIFAYDPEVVEWTQCNKILCLT